MDLTMDEVADLLDVPKEQVESWLSEGSIPSYQLNQQEPLFSRSEIEAWIMRRRREGESFGEIRQQGGKRVAPSSSSRNTKGIRSFALYRALSRGNVYYDISGETKEEIFSQVMGRIAPTMDLDVEVVTELLLDRETMTPTALGNGIGIPHTRELLLLGSYDVIGIVYLEKAIAYGSLDGQPVDILFFLFASDDKRHLNLLAKIAHLSTQPDMMSYLRTRPEKEALLEKIRVWESLLAQQ